MQIQDFVALVDEENGRHTIITADQAETEPPDEGSLTWFPLEEPAVLTVSGARLMSVVQIEENGTDTEYACTLIHVGDLGMEDGRMAFMDEYEEEDPEDPEDEDEDEDDAGLEYPADAQEPKEETNQ